MRVVGGPLSRGLLSVFVVWHLLAVTGGLLEGSPVGDGIRRVTKGYEQTLGVHQNWTMFVPNPSRSTEWLEVDGQAPDGTLVHLSTLDVPPAPDGFIPLYGRANKFDRNALPEKRGEMRKGYARYLCREAKAAGTPVRQITFREVHMDTPWPEKRAAAGDRAHWPHVSTELGTEKCP